jgi:hypothetical protein
MGNHFGVKHGNLRKLQPHCQHHVASCVDSNSERTSYLGVGSISHVTFGGDYRTHNQLEFGGRLSGGNLHERIIVEHRLEQRGEQCDFLHNHRFDDRTGVLRACSGKALRTAQRVWVQLAENPRGYEFEADVDLRAD